MVRILLNDNGAIDVPFSFWRITRILKKNIIASSSNIRIEIIFDSSNNVN